MATLARTWAGRTATMAVALAVLALAGCQTYSPYGYGGYGGAYTMPGGTYVPQQGPMLAPTPAATLQPTPQAYSETPTLQLSQPGSLPNSQATVSAPSRPLPEALSADTGVPEPRNRPAPPTNSLTEDDDGITLPKIDPTSAQLSSPTVENALGESAALGDETFGEPARLDPSRQPGTSTLLTENDPSPYAFDEEGYAWLRGIADFDQSEGVWRVQYSTNPVGDQYSGVLTLAPDPRLENLLIGDIVLVRGHVDLIKRDFNQKPMFVLLSEDEETVKERGVMKIQPKRRKGPRKIED